jgi:hypothetical protein
VIKDEHCGDGGDDLEPIEPIRQHRRRIIHRTDGKYSRNSQDSGNS